MIFNIEKFLKDFQIPNDQNNKHATEGWIQIQCPFCIGNKDWHLGINIAEGFANCWKCGYHHINEVVSTLLSVTNNEAYKIIKDYEQTETTSLITTKKTKRKIPKEVKLPKGTTDLTDRHRNYLKKRNYDPDYIINKYKLKGIGPFGPYKFRIIIPIYLNNKLVSYQAKDITNKNKIPYKPCPAEEEITPYKSILYNCDNIFSDTIIIVEGVFDVWRIGDGTVCIFGTGYSEKQVAFILSIHKDIHTIKNYYIMFDAEYEAQRKANILAEQLSLVSPTLNTNIKIIELEKGDPDNLNQKEVKELREDIFI